MRKMKLLTFSTLYPNPAMPRHGVFVEQRLRKLVASGEIETRVVAPVPWFPASHPRFGAYSAYARVPRTDKRFDVEIEHPRYLLIPKLGMTSAPYFMAAACLPVLKRHLRSGYEFDVIDAHYFYPDGVAAVMLGRWLKKPVVVTSRGTDINLIPKYRLPRKMIQSAAADASHLVTVCQALKDSLVELDVDSERITVLRNGVDLEFFTPTDRHEARKILNLDADANILLSVGHLIERKGHDIPIRALKSLPEVQLLIAGDGELQRSLHELAENEGVSDRVRFRGNVPHENLRHYFSASDALVLASSREGWANVLLESMACGTPVIASNVWGTPEVVQGPAAGELMHERTPEGLVHAYRSLMNRSAYWAWSPSWI